MEEECESTFPESSPDVDTDQELASETCKHAGLVSTENENEAPKIGLDHAPVEALGKEFQESSGGTDPDQVIGVLEPHFDNDCNSIDLDEKCFVKPKSKTELNTELTPENESQIAISHFKNTTKNDLNFKADDDTGSLLPEEMGSFDENLEFSCFSASKKSALNLPQQDGKELGSGTNESGNVDVDNALPSVKNTLVSNNPLVNVSHRSQVSRRHTGDGRNALNYGPQTALEAMLSDLLKSSEREEDTSTEDGPPVQEQSENSAGLRNRRRTERTNTKKNGKKRKKKKDLDTVDVGDDALGVDIPQAFCCPVCLDVFYNAHIVRPCGHTFCEPCLRRLAKYSQDARRPTPCPVCRNLIDSCTKDKDLTSKVELYLPDDFRRRRRMESSNRFMRHPLPSTSPITLSPKRQLSQIVSRLERNRLSRRRIRVGVMPVRMDIMRFISIVLAFIVLKALLLMALLCVYYLVYDHGFHVKFLDISISGASGFSRYLTFMVPRFWGFAGFILFGVLLVLALRYTRPKDAMWQKRIASLSDIQRHEF